MRDLRIETLTEAFYHDPLVEFLLPEESLRRKRLSAGIEFLLGLSGNTWSVGSENSPCAGVIGAASPEDYPPSIFRFTVVLTRLIFKSLIRMPPRLMAQWLHIFQQFDTMHPLQPHWYILILGVHPVHQGKGLGGELLKEVLQRADKERVPVYLESANPKNLDFYRTYGFQVIDEIVPIAGCPPVWGLIRAPEPRENSSSL